MPHREAAAEPELPPVARRPSLIRPLPRRQAAPQAESARPHAAPLQDRLTSPRELGRDAVPAVAAAWPEPQALLQRLDELAGEGATGKWAAEAGRLVRELGPASAEASDEAISILERLEELARRVAPLAAALDNQVVASKLRRAGYALNRRLAVWQEIVKIGNPGTIVAQAPQVDPEQLALCLAEIDAITGESAEGEAWRRYLLIDALREWSHKCRSAEKRLPPALAQRALERLTQTPLSVEQRQFVSSGPVAALRGELRRWAAEPVDPARLLGHLERYERSGLGSDARLLARDCLHLGLSPADDRRRLAERVDVHYRNANVRVAVTGELLNRLMPKRDPEYARVRDTVLGVPVYGRSLTSTDVSVRLLPDPNRVRIALEITGQVASLTSSTMGPATFYNKSNSMYTARKPLEVDLEGIHLRPAEVEVYNNTRLHGLQTDFDPIPLVGPLVNGVARSQHEQKRAAASYEVKHKIAREARQRIDAEAGARLGKASETLRGRFLEPMDALSVSPTMIGAETTEQRFTMRLRLAGEDQLGSHTPRPRAPSNCLASFQVHETAINNVLGRLELEGRTFTMPELSRRVTTRLNCPQPWETDPAHEDVTITFAEKDAVGVRLQDGQFVLTLSIAKLRKPPRRWKDFQVRIFYRPQTDGCSAALVRDGIIHLIGTRLGTGSQIAVRGIFTRTFPKKRPVKITPERLLAKLELADLAITQFVLDDGWVGVALGPNQTTLRPALLRR